MTDGGGAGQATRGGLPHTGANGEATANTHEARRITPCEKLDDMRMRPRRQPKWRVAAYPEARH